MRIVMVMLSLLILGLGIDAQEENVTIRQIVLSADATQSTGYLAVAVGMQAYLYDLNDLDSTPQTFGLGNDYGGIALNHDGSLLVGPGDCNVLDWLATATGERMAALTVNHPYCDPLRLIFSHDGETVFVSDGMVYRTQDLLDDGSNSKDEVLLQVDVADPAVGVFSPDDTLLVYMHGAASAIDIYDVQSDERITAITATAYMRSNYRPFRDIVFSGDGLLLAALVENGPTYVFEVATGDLRQSYWLDTEAASIAVWLDDADGTIRSVHRGYNGVTYWRVYRDLQQTLDDVTPIELDTRNPAFGTFSTDGSLLVIVTDENTLALHNGTDGTLLATLSAWFKTPES
jgi:WD40 repeat protein